MRAFKLLCVLSFIFLCAPVYGMVNCAVTPWDNETQDFSTVEPSMETKSLTSENSAMLNNFDSSLVSVADYLRGMQADVTEDNAGNGVEGIDETPDDPDDGGWDWVLTSPPAPFSHSTANSPENITGATALGLYYAYLETGEYSYLIAMKDAAFNMHADHTQYRSASNITFLILCDDLPEITGVAYADSAKAKFDDRIAEHGSGTGLAEYIRDARAASYPNGIIAWDIGLFVEAAIMLDSHYPTDTLDYMQIAIDMTEVIWQDSFNDNPGHFDVVDDAGYDAGYGDVNFYWFNLGVTGLINSFNGTDTHTAEIPGLITTLLEGQASNGSFSYQYGGNTADAGWQSTAYTVMCLAALDQPLYQAEINRAAYWLSATQDTSGGFVYSDGTHYPEIAGECASALYFSTNTLNYTIVDDNYSSQADVDAYNSVHSTNFVWGYDAFATIQEGIDALNPEGTVYVLAGNYDDALQIENKNNITITGESKSLVILKPASTLAWDVGGYGGTRRAAVRVVTSTGISFSNMTFDFDLIKGNNIAGIFFWDATGVINGNELKNMSVSDASSGYYELTCYLRAPSYTPAARAEITLSNNTFMETGRLAIVTHQYLHTIISDNIFFKTTDDFGYAMEIGSQSTAIVSGNTIYGYDTPAASDQSASAGIYVENSFSTGEVGLIKNVVIEDNEIYDCQWGLYLGNGFDGYTGDVDLQIDITQNNIHDNIEGGIFVTDEDKDNGSSITVISTDNILNNNGQSGYFISTSGDGDVTVSIDSDSIAGHEIGIYCDDYATGTSGSSYSVTVRNSEIVGNVNFGIENDYSGFTVDAIHNYWGANSGPLHVTTNPDGLANAVSDYVLYEPWCNADFSYCDFPIICGDANGDGFVDLGDAVYIINYVFRGGSAPDPLLSGDANCDGFVDLGDAVYLINYIFRGGPAPCANCP
ncbi:MAG: right-handed parallel beta-helix repeat-containing protein [candidate division Zixibacteria bacterium]|nr:right-handed parallel beta-helix repeat-containing protein [candidate division Zixibacteria bacterium]